MLNTPCIENDNIFWWKFQVSIRLFVFLIAIKYRKYLIGNRYFKSKYQISSNFKFQTFINSIYLLKL